MLPQSREFHFVYIFYMHLPRFASHASYFHSSGYANQKRKKKKILRMRLLLTMMVIWLKVFKFFTHTNIYTFDMTWMLHKISTMSHSPLNFWHFFFYLVLFLHIFHLFLSFLSTCFIAEWTFHCCSSFCSFFFLHSSLHFIRHHHRHI